MEIQDKQSVNFSTHSGISELALEESDEGRDLTNSAEIIGCLKLKSKSISVSFN